MAGGERESSDAPSESLTPPSESPALREPPAGPPRAARRPSSLPIALPPALALLAGVTAGIFSGLEAAGPLCAVPAFGCIAIVSWRARRPVATAAVLAAGYFAAGAALGADARDEALHPPLRAVLDEQFGGFAIDTPGPEGDHDPLLTYVVVAEDAAPGAGFVSLRADVRAIEIGRRRYAVSGRVAFSVSGEAALSRLDEWRAGRTLRTFATFRRPARYLDDGVPDGERDLALDGIALLGSIKSGLLVDVVSPGTWLEERAADARAHVRRAVGRRVAPHDAIAAGITTAVLIGDRTGLPAEVRDRLQAAGTYHVIAISGGNIAILAALALGTFAVLGVRGRAAAAGGIVVLLAYAQVVAAGPSVWRATLMAVLYFTARAIDHRSPAWQATAVAAGLMVTLHPLDVCDPGFVLTFGATAALLEGARQGSGLVARPRALAWVAASIAASLATEVALLPVAAQTFSRVTAAGLVLNLLAVPLMAVVQTAGMIVVAFDAIDVIAAPAGHVAHAAAGALVESARLVEVAPWLAARVPPPGIVLTIAYYLSLALLLAARRRLVRAAFGLLFAVSALAIVLGARLPIHAGTPSPGLLRLTVFDVGQGEAMLLQLPRGGALLVDAGGAPFGAGTFDIGARVLAPALWARGVGALDALIVSHGDPDHIGGAASILRTFPTRELWTGIPVPAHAPTRELAALAAQAGARAVARRAGQVLEAGGARIRVLHPQEPDWERPRVRNDDSIVLEVSYGRAAFLLTGDISAEVERRILPALAPAPLRVLKVAHHGSRTSTSPDLLERWKPQVAIISSGRGNSFGHPAPEVLRRLEAQAVTVFRTDLHGQVTVETDGESIAVRTYVDSRRRPRRRRTQRRLPWRARRKLPQRTRRTRRR